MDTSTRARLTSGMAHTHSHACLRKDLVRRKAEGSDSEAAQKPSQGWMDEAGRGPRVCSMPCGATSVPDRYRAAWDTVGAWVHVGIAWYLLCFGIAWDMRCKHPLRVRPVAVAKY